MRPIADEQVSTTPRLMSTRTADLALIAGFWVAVGVSVAVVVAGAHGPLLGRVFALWLIWTPIGVVISTRGLRDPSVTARGNPFRRAGRVVANWCGWTGLITATVIIVTLLLTAPNTWMSSVVYAGVAAAAAVLLIFRGAIRNIGTGVLTACVAPVWVFVPVLVVVLSFPILATIVAALVSTAVERRRRGD